MKTVVAVAGPSVASPEESRLAYSVGRAIARRGAVLLTGGRGGVMEAASHGASAEGGLVVGLLPGLDADQANAHVDIALPTGLGEVRNIVVASAGAALIAVGGGLGTLSEVALALKRGRRVVLLSSVSWEVPSMAPEPERAESPEEAVALALGEEA